MPSKRRCDLSECHAPAATFIKTTRSGPGSRLYACSSLHAARLEALHLKGLA